MFPRRDQVILNRATDRLSADTIWAEKWNAFLLQNYITCFPPSHIQTLLNNKSRNEQVIFINFRQIKEFSFIKVVIFASLIQVYLDMCSDPSWSE